MPRLVLTSPELRELKLKPGSNSIGRGEANDFQIANPSVSTFHCEIELSGDTAVLRDNNSTNGTFVNQARVSVAELKPGQTIQLGSVSMTYQADAPAQPFTVMAPARPSGGAEPPPPPPVPPMRPAPVSAPTALPAVPAPAAPAASAPQIPKPSPAPYPAPIRIAAPTAAPAEAGTPNADSEASSARAGSIAVAPAPPPKSTPAVRISIPAAPRPAPATSATPALPESRSEPVVVAPASPAALVAPSPEPVKAAPCRIVTTPMVAPTRSQPAEAGTPDAERALPAAPVARPLAPVAKPISLSTPAPEAVPSALPLSPAAQAQIETSECCRSHPKAPATYWCGKCQKFFCTACINILHGHHACRRCGEECEPVRFVPRVSRTSGFFGRIPGAFAYPFRGGGVMMVLVGMGVFALLKIGQLVMGMGLQVEPNGNVRIGLRSLISGTILVVVTGGYLFAFLQNILHSTASEDPEIPDLPSPANFLDDLVLPFLRLLGLLAICFGPAMALGTWAASSQSGPAAISALAALIFGLIYFPMAFLAVAMLDSLPAANPVVVVPSMFKVPLEYFVGLLMFAGWLGFQKLGDIVVNLAFPEGLETKSMAMLFLMLGTRLVWAFFNFYLVIVAVRILGNIFVTKKDRLGWI